MRVLELRQYTLLPGRRDELIELFDREFVEPQEALGMQIVGTFRDLDDADRFIWLRAFDDMAGRGEALSAFYTGPAWKTHSSHDLLPRPALRRRPGAGDRHAHRT